MRRTLPSSRRNTSTRSSSSASTKRTRRRGATTTAFRLDRPPPVSNSATCCRKQWAARRAATWRRRLLARHNRPRTSPAPATNAYGVQQARSLGNQRSFGDYLADTNRAAGRDLQTADQAADFMKGNSAVEGLQLNQAQHAGDGMKLLGSIGTGIGGLGVKAGLFGTGTGVNGYGSPLGSMFGGDQTYQQVRQAGLDGGLTLNPDGSIY